MDHFMSGKKTVGEKINLTNSKKKGLYCALKSEHEVYYQMASLFKEVANDENNMAATVLTSLLKNKQAQPSDVRPSI
jgi:hypothetical protein